MKIPGGYLHQCFYYRVPGNDFCEYHKKDIIVRN